MPNTVKTSRDLAPLFGFPRLWTALCLAIFATLFWSLRIDYWLNTAEAPFSDMLDYITIGQNIAHHFFFGSNAQYYSYLTPVTPSLIAIAIAIGGAHFQMVFRLIVQTISFFGSLVLAYELFALTGARWLGALWLLIIALSKPSIFWSYKVSTETVSEALFICAIALSLRAYRTRSMMIAAISGLACLLLALNRPQFFPSAICIGACFVAAGFQWRSKGPADHKDEADNGSSKSRTRRGLPRWVAALRIADRRRLVQAVCFAVGAAVIWTPWIVRNYRHYGALIPTATSSADSVFWEYGGRPIRAGAYDTLRLSDGRVMRDFNLEDFKRELSATPNDYVRSRVMLAWGEAWMKANLWDLPRLFSWRLKQILFANGADGLTKVSRDRLFGTSPPGFNDPYPPVSWIDLVLLDKSPLAVIFGAFGALLLAVRRGVAGLIVAGLWLPPWISVALVLGYERAVESMISFTLWLAALFVAMIVGALYKVENAII